MFKILLKNVSNNYETNVHFFILIIIAGCRSKNVFKFFLNELQNYQLISFKAESIIDSDWKIYIRFWLSEYLKLMKKNNKDYLMGNDWIMLII